MDSQDFTRTTRMFNELMAYISTIDPKQWLLFFLFPFFLTVAALEAWHYRDRSIYSIKDSLASMTLGGSYLVFEVIFYALFVWSIFDWAYQYRIATIEITALSFIALYLLVEFCFWVYHFTSHKVRLFWATHSVHHASEHMNFTTAMRQSAIYPLSAIWGFFVPLTLLGFEREWIFFALAINLAFQYFIHTQWIDKLPAAVEFIFNTPSHHRVHHGRNDQYVDKNFGGTLIIFDRLFGTFQAEDRQEAPEYGLKQRQPDTYNPIKLTFFEWIELFRDMKQAGSWQNRVKHVFMGPEWSRNPKEDT